MVSEIAPKRRRFAIPRRAQMRAEGVRASEREAFQRRSRKRDVVFSLKVRKPAHAWPISPAGRTAALVRLRPISPGLRNGPCYPHSGHWLIRGPRFFRGLFWAFLPRSI